MAYTLNTFTPSTDAEKMAIFKARRKADYSMNDTIGTIMEVKGIIQSPTTIRNGDHEEEHTKTVIITEDNTTYSTASENVANFIHDLVESFGSPDKWSFAIICDHATSTKGRKYLTMDICPKP